VDFELKFRFLPGFEFGKASELSHLCTVMQIHHLTLFDLSDMHRPALKMEEYMEFERGLCVKQFLKIWSGEIDIV
jgi:hypothetical protein